MQREPDFAGDGHRIDRQMRHGGMTAAALTRIVQVSTISWQLEHNSKVIGLEE
jgi:hypothetical protein